MTDVQAAFAANLRGERARRGLRQVDLGQELHLGPTSISDLEHNHRAVTLAELVIICRALDVSLADLLRGADPAELAILGL